VFLKAALNGGRTKAEHPRTPITAQEIAADAVAALAAGADVVHVHARNPEGNQSIAPSDIAVMVTAIRAAAPAAVVGTTTGLWTCGGNHEARCSSIRGWQALPDFASVAFSEPGAAEAALLVLERGMQLESAVWSLDDVPALLSSPTLHSNVRILIEPADANTLAAVEHARAIAAEIVSAGIRCPILYHGEGQTAWPVLRAALEDGVETRIGFEDTVDLPDGTLAKSNADLVAAAVRLGAEQHAKALTTS